MVEVNYLAVLAAGVVSFALGWLWYGPLFGKRWAALSGVTMPGMMTPELKRDMRRNYALTLAGSLVMAYVLVHMLTFASAYLDAAGASAGIAAGFWSWLGFIAPVLLAPVLWEGKSWRLYALNVGYYFVSLLVMGAILSLWM